MPAADLAVMHPNAQNTASNINTHLDRRRIMQGEPLCAAMLDCVVAASSQIGDSTRAFETFAAYATLGLVPGAQAYNAVLQGCIYFGLLDSVPKVLLRPQPCDASCAGCKKCSPSCVTGPVPELCLCLERCGQPGGLVWKRCA